MRLCVVCAGRSNIWGTEFVLYDMGADPNENRNKNEKKYDVTPIRKELCAVTLVSGGWTYVWMNANW